MKVEPFINKAADLLSTHVLKTMTTHQNTLVSKPDFMGVIVLPIQQCMY